MSQFVHMRQYFFLADSRQQVLLFLRIVFPKQNVLPQGTVEDPGLLSSVGEAPVRCH